MIFRWFYYSFLNWIEVLLIGGNDNESRGIISLHQEKLVVLNYVFSLSRPEEIHRRLRRRRIFLGLSLSQQISISLSALPAPYIFSSFLFLYIQFLYCVFLKMTIDQICDLGIWFIWYWTCCNFDCDSGQWNNFLVCYLCLKFWLIRSIYFMEIAQVEFR